MEKSEVFIKPDNQTPPCIIACEGGSTKPKNLDDWIKVDEGTGDRYNLCQSHYFEGGLYTTDGIPRYKYADGACILRTDAEIEADRSLIPIPGPAKTLEEVATYLNETAKAVMLLSVDL